ncbi:TIGR00341 family protein [bacterium]|nr:TIGR00341 family protein [bacterium]
MTVALLINSANNAPQLIPWGAAFAEAQQTDFLIVVIRRAKGQKVWKNIGSADAESPTLKAIVEEVNRLGLCINEGEEADAETEEDAQTKVSVKELRGPDPGDGLTADIEKLNISLLVIPADTGSTAEEDETKWQQNLYRHVPCTAMYLRDDTIQKLHELRVLVAVTDTQDDEVALQFASRLTEANKGSVTAVYVEPDIDTVSKQVGARNLERIARNSIGKKADSINRIVFLGDNVPEAIRQSKAEDFDLILCGKRRHQDVRRILDAQYVQPTATTGIPALATIRSGVPLAGRLMQKARRFIGRYVPPLEREQRVELVSRIQASSKWDFDFIALILLSTLIAALGLIQNSGSVVIGAMLVAPLMTPIIATGLGMAQGNIRLMTIGVRTVFRGFALAFVLGVIVGWIVWVDPPGSEITGRGHPNINDLVIALVSGVAAAYALFRPNLLSALPGVAIAAALVPPLAVAGMAIAVGEFKLGLGAVLLFLTNIVAITVGTTLTFRIVGIRTERRSDKPAETWPRWVLLFIVIISLILAALMPLLDDEPKSDAVDQVVEALKALDTDHNGELSAEELKPLFDRKPTQ